MSYSSSSDAEQSLSSASLETTLQGTDVTTVVSRETADFFRDDISESASSREQWSSPRYVASPVPVPRAVAPTQVAGGRTGAVATPAHQPLARPAAEPPETGADAQPATDTMELLSQLAAQHQIQQQEQIAERRVQQERQAKTDDMMRKLMEKVVYLQTPNLNSQSPHVNRPRMTGPLALSSVRHGPSYFCPPPLVPEERRGAYTGPPSPPPDPRGGSPTTTPGSDETGLHKPSCFS